VKPSLIMRIADGACMEPKSLPTSEVCEMPSCEEGRQTSTQKSFASSKPRWSVGIWSQVILFQRYVRQTLAETIERSNGFIVDEAYLIKHNTLHVVSRPLYSSVFRHLWYRKKNENRKLRYSRCTVQPLGRTRGARNL